MCNIEQLSDAIMRLIREPELRFEMGRRGRQRAEELFDSRRLIDEHIALYGKVAAGVFIG